MFQLDLILLQVFLFVKGQFLTYFLGHVTYSVCLVFYIKPCVLWVDLCKKLDNKKGYPVVGSPWFT